MLEIELRLTVSKATAILTVLSLWPSSSFLSLSLYYICIYIYHNKINRTDRTCLTLVFEVNWQKERSVIFLKCLTILSVETDSTRDTVGNLPPGCGYLMCSPVRS